MKTLVAQEIAKRVKNGDILGVGTGTTVDAALEAIGKRVSEEGLLISAVPTSLQSAWRCQELGIAVMHSGYRGFLSWGFDGADEVTRDRWIIKGKGGALLTEKLVAKRCKKFVVIVDSSKVVEQLGAGYPVPVEVIPEGLMLAEAGLKALGAVDIKIRSGSGIHGPVMTERGNILLDVRFPRVTAGLEQDIKGITGVVESGLFIGYVAEVLVADSSGVTSL